MKIFSSMFVGVMITAAIFSGVIAGVVIVVVMISQILAFSGPTKSPTPLPVAPIDLPVGVDRVVDVKPAVDPVSGIVSGCRDSFGRDWFAVGIDDQGTFAVESDTGGVYLAGILTKRDYHKLFILRDGRRFHASRSVLPSLGLDFVVRNGLWAPCDSRKP